MLNAEGAKLQVLEVNDFSGGLTDDFVAGQTNQYQVCDNLDIGDDNILVSRPGSALKSFLHPRLPTNGRIGGINDLDGLLIAHSERRIYSLESDGFHLAQTPNAALPLSSGDLNSICSMTKWNKHMIAVNSDGGQPVRVFRDNANILKAETLGLPKDEAALTVTNYAPADGDATYIWATHFKYVYQVGDVTFEEIGPVTFHDLGINDFYPQTGSAIKELQFVGAFPNPDVLPYNVAGITVEIYRNTDKGSTFYKVGSIPATESVLPSTFTDTVLDEDLTANSVLYIDGGVLDHDRPPACKIVHQTNDITIFARILEDGVFKNNKLRIANQGMPYSSPGSFTVTFDEDIVGVSSVGQYPIVFCETCVYRLDGMYNMKGAGSVLKKKISDTVGLVSSQSTIQIESGVYFAGTDGFYFCNGSGVVRISNDINKTYAKMIDQGFAHRIAGTMDRIKKRLLWSVTLDEGIAENRKIFVGHLTKARGTTVPFTTWSGGLNEANFTASALHYFENQVIRGDKDGFLLAHDYDYASDPTIELAAPPDEWGIEPLIYDYVSVCFDFGSASVRKWTPTLVVNVNNKTSVSLNVFSANDNSQEFKNLKPIIKKGNVAFGDPTVLFGDDIYLGSYPIINSKLRFPTPLRCSYKQIRFTNAYIPIIESTVDTQADFNQATCEFTLTNPEEIWPYDCQGYMIRVPAVDQDFRIKRRTDKVLILEEAASVIPDGTYAWEMSGYRTNEILELLSYSIYFSFTSPSQEPYRANGAS